MHATRNFELDSRGNAGNIVVGIKRLACATVLQAMYEAHCGNVEAMFFLTDEALNPNWLDLADIPEENVWDWMAGGMRLSGRSRRNGTK